ncbi:MAG: peptidoglycan editing factor PgeF [Lachnospiraceae bacterium]
MIRKYNKEKSIDIPVLRKKNEVEYLIYPAFEETKLVNHLFTTRHGGVSEGYFSSMNLSYARGDRKENVDENYRRISEILECKLEDFVLTDQTHTSNIRVVTKGDKGKGILYEKDYEDIDGFITNEEGVALVTLYADCVPLFFLDPIKKVIGMSHSGWKGSVLNIAAKTLDKMNSEYNCKIEDILVAIGPSICMECYEVSEDVILEFNKSIEKDDFYYKKNNGKYQLDLWKANEYLLLDAGIKKENLSITNICTCCNEKDLFSHRASQGKRGNLAGVIMLKKS